MEPIVQTVDLCKYYGKGENQVKAVQHASLTIRKGEFTAIVGKSGSGKSTLLHMIGGLDTPTSGRVLIKGKDIFSYKEDALAVFRRRKIGFIFQSFNLVSSINVWENIVLPIGLDGRKVDEKFIMDIVRTLGLEEKLHNLPNTLSGGQQQRVAIARALASKPDILCADEPTGNLDSHTSEEVIGLLKMSVEKYGSRLLFHGIPLLHLWKGTLNYFLSHIHLHCRYAAMSSALLQIHLRAGLHPEECNTSDCPEWMTQYIRESHPDLCTVCVFSDPVQYG